MAAPLPALLDKNGSVHAVWLQISQALCLHPGGAGPASQPVLPAHCHWLLAGSAIPQVYVISPGLCLHAAASISVCGALVPPFNQGRCQAGSSCSTAKKSCGEHGAEP